MEFFFIKSTMALISFKSTVDSWLKSLRARSFH
jgi:hypothetical protein